MCLLSFSLFPNPRKRITHPQTRINPSPPPLGAHEVPYAPRCRIKSNQPDMTTQRTTRQHHNITGESVGRPTGASLGGASVSRPRHVRPRHRRPQPPRRQRARRRRQRRPWSQTAGDPGGRPRRQQRRRAREGVPRRRLTGRLLLPVVEVGVVAEVVVRRSGRRSSRRCG